MALCELIQTPPTAEIELPPAQNGDSAYDAWLREKVGATLKKLELGGTDLIEQQDVLPLLAARMKARQGI